MKLLESLYAQEFKSITFHPRKAWISAHKSILFGPKASGKTTLLHDYLSRRKKGSYLYIDFDDLRIDQALFIGLPNFIKAKGITLLVLDNFDFSFTVPQVDEVIISTNQDHTLEGFERVEIFPLDFEEFIAFAKRHIEIEAIFNDFAVAGTYPTMSQVPKDRIVKEFQKLIRLILPDPLERTLFKSFALAQGEKLSPYTLFQELKIFHKISKDRFYALLKRFEQERLIFLLPHYDKPKAKKKIYLIDFAIKSILTYDKDFIKRFENIIFLELHKSKEEIYYTDMIDFYLPQKNLAVIPMLFLPIEMIQTKLNRIQKELEHYQIKRVEILTLEAEGSIELEMISCEIIPFWNWALSR